MDVLQADSSVKKSRTLPINNSRPDFYNINARIKFCEKPFTFSETKIRTDGRRTFPCSGIYLVFSMLKKLPNSMLKVPTSSLRNKKK